MSKSKRFHSARGFSLLEVLIAVVIMSIGLLALASLQLSLVRSSSETKAQSIATALAKQKIEQLLSFQAVGGNANCNSPATSSTNTCYRQIADEGSAPVDGDASVTGDQPIGGVSFNRAVVVRRYVYDKTTGSSGFKLQTLDNALDSTLTTDPVTYLVGKEFKRVDVSVTWTDATGTGRSETVEGAIAAFDPSDSAALSKSGKGATARKARAIITNPSSVAGVIPIAIGNGSDTAATNPRPIIVGQGNNATTVETRFDVYTYAALTGSAAQAQSRVETAVVGCKCTMTALDHSAARPTYWNGSAYTTPTTAANIPVSAPVTGNSVTQSDLCTICCRDHHDPTGVAGEKFDPRRTNHNHYEASDLTTIVNTINPGNYAEACRLIRVDGVFRVSTEPYDDHYGLLPTVGLLASTATTTVANAVPATGIGSISESYQTFVVNYLKARFVDVTAYNTVLDPTGVTGYSALQTPTTAGIDGTTSPQYMHSRGLLIDYLSADAIAALAQAKATCIVQSCSSSDLQTAILRLLPFTSINATELAKWSSDAPTKVDVSLLQDFAEAIDVSLPVSGKAGYNSGSNPEQVIATTNIQGGSAGLALTAKVFPDSEYANNALADTQPFVIGANAVVGGFIGGEAFSIQLAGTNGDFLANVLIGNPAQVYFGTPILKSCTPDAANMTPFGCITNTSFGLGGSTPIKIGNYNRSGSKLVLNSCTRSGTGSSTDTTAMPYAINFDLSSATVDSVAINSSGFSVTNPDIPGIPGEYTTFSANPVNVSSVVVATFSAKSYLCPSNWSIYINSSGTDAGMTPTTTGSNPQCPNVAGTRTPSWDTTSYVACWSGFTP